jgi:hypothetical protein
MTDFLGKATAAADKPFTANPNQQVAGTSDATQQANTMIGGIAGGGVPAGLTNAQSTLSGIAGYKPQDISTADLSKYMNPYAQSVIDVQKQQAQQDFGQQQAGRDAQAVQAGAFGGTRQATQDAIAQQGLNRNLQGIEATGLNTAYNNATQLFQQGQANQLQGNQLGINAANAEGNLASTSNNLQLQDAAALSGVGQQQQTQNQNVLNAQNQQWNLQNNYPAAQAGLYSQLLNGTWKPQDTTSTTTPAPSLLSQLLGVATAGIGAYGATR